MNSIIVALTGLPAVVLLAACGTGPAAPEGQPYRAEPRETLEVIHGREVSDPFRWLEAVDKPAVMAWAGAQNRATEAFAGVGDPAFNALAEEIEALSRFETRRNYVEAGDKAFFAVGAPGSPDIRSYRVVDGQIERVLAPDRNGVRLFSPVPSPDGRYAALGRLPETDNLGALVVIDAGTGDQIGEPLPGFLRGASSIAWAPDASALVYTRYDAPDASSPRVRSILVEIESGRTRVLHGLSRAEADWTIQSSVSSNGERVFHQIRSGSEPEVQILSQFLAGGAPEVLAEAGGATRIVLGDAGGDLIIYTDEDAPEGRIVAIDLQDPDRQREVVPAIPGQPINANSLVGGNALGLFGSYVVAAYQDGARTVVRGFDLDGAKTFEHETPPTGAIWGGFNGWTDNPVFYYRFLGLTEPASVYAMDARTGDRRLVHAPRMNFDPASYVARREFVDRPDGARVPVLIAHRRDLDPDRPAPVYLYGYGAFGWVSLLWYQPHVIKWMDRGGVFAVAGVRGGGEFGRAWHEAGRGANRQTAIDDFAAVSRWMIDTGLSDRDRLAANGGSLSGALAAAAAVQNPDLYAALVLDFPMIDVLRFQKFGRARAWTGEIGDISDPAVFEALYAYSPYHNVEAGVCYPATLVRVGEHDPTVTPTHGYKFAAALQHAQGCGAPILLDVMENAGHDYGGTPAEIAASHALALRFLDRVLTAQQ